MAKFFDNVTGRQKVFLLLVGFSLMIGGLVLFPDATAILMLWIEDLAHHAVDFARNLGGKE